MNLTGLKVVAPKHVNHPSGCSVKIEELVRTALIFLLSAPVMEVFIVQIASTLACNRSRYVGWHLRSIWV